MNNTGVPDEAVFLNLQGSAVTGTTGTGATLSNNTDYALSDILGTISGAGSGGPTGSVSNLSISSFSGAMFATIGQKIGSSQPATSVVSGRLESTIFGGNNDNNNFDTSYVSSISLPLSYAVKRRSNGTLVPLSSQANQITTNGPAAFTALTQSTSITPNDARISANYNVLNTGGTQLGTLTGTASILSPSNVGTSYHDWTSSNTGIRNTSSLIPWMQTQGPVTVANYNVPLTAPHLPGANIGFGGSSGTSPFGSDDPTNRFLQGQDYSLSAQFTNDMNPGGANAQLTAQGITAGTPGVIMTGGGGSYASGDTGTFNVYITNSQLDNSNGIYGANPQYVILWTDPSAPKDGGNDLAVTTTNTNSLTDRIVGDLLTGINMGWTDSQTQIDTHATSTNTSDKLTGTIFSGSTDLISQLSTGEFIYLLDLQQVPGAITDSTVPLWFGNNIETNELFYNTYGSALADETGAYTLAYSDRLAGGLSPDIFYTPGGQTVDISDLYLEITLNPGDFTFTPVPEPSTYALLLGFGVVGLAWVRRRKK
ncbi:PEP-CTERM sorting domain-containing protein [Rubellicoccus peritrichatus]|uniref:PEP-CTERM sorting domain-containing protein n=1 Tax=Rubellicoccus peritrichatus TaxID=3080537 RepID=A0AAQ3QVB9_9BACT|nr:PEP-CTERM sorting domain-containing protein [Puniceicoccus sp. CR14]WOO40682.1 PEP-CTERM sorting domain-containing protein [Puniceicoccus sp. CR14]